MDITKCIPSIKISGLSLTDPPEEQVTLVSGSFVTQRGHWVHPFLLFFKNLFKPKCKIFPFDIFCIIILFQKNGVTTNNF